MNVLVIGQGGREHALVRALRLSPSVKTVHALPGSDGIQADQAFGATCHNFSWEDFAAVLRVVREAAITYVVIGPEVALAAGLSDALREAGVAVFGPSSEGARLESSKVFSKEFMIEAGVPTARSFVVTSVEETRLAMAAFNAPYVLKADGLAAGKGVFICKTANELLVSARSIFEERSLGEAGAKALLEEFSPGYEVSCLILTNGETYESFVLAQDNKRLLDGDEGPNTGGMGVVAPVQLESELRERIDREILAPSVAHLKKRGLLYRGVLYVGLMITPKGPSVIEYNSRWGDPEAQVILPLLDGDWGQVFHAVSVGEMPRLRWKNQSCCCVVVAAAGYPDKVVKGTQIEGLGTASSSSDRYFLHAGTQRSSDQVWVTAGGRVLNSIGIGSTLGDAIDAAYEQAKEIRGEGLQMRKDIGAKLAGR